MGLNGCYCGDLIEREKERERGGGGGGGDTHTKVDKQNQKKKKKRKSEKLRYRSRLTAEHNYRSAWVLYQSLHLLVASKTIPL